MPQAKKHHEAYSDEEEEDEEDTIEYSRPKPKGSQSRPAHPDRVDATAKTGAFTTPGNINVAPIPAQRQAGDHLANPRIKFALPRTRRRFSRGVADTSLPRPWRMWPRRP